MPTARTQSRCLLCRSTLLLLTLPLLLAVGCATPLPPLASLPAKQLQIPPPPVTLGPAHTSSFLREARSYSEEVETWLFDAQALTTTVPPKSGD